MFRARFHHSVSLEPDRIKKANERSGSEFFADTITRSLLHSTLYYYALFSMRGFGRLWARPSDSSTNPSVSRLLREAIPYKNKTKIQENKTNRFYIIAFTIEKRCRRGCDGAGGERGKGEDGTRRQQKNKDLWWRQYTIKSKKKTDKCVKSVHVYLAASKTPKGNSEGRLKRESKYGRLSLHWIHHGDAISRRRSFARLNQGKGNE